MKAAPGMEEMIKRLDGNPSWMGRPVIQKGMLPKTSRRMPINRNCQGHCEFGDSSSASILERQKYKPSRINASRNTPAVNIAVSFPRLGNIRDLESLQPAGHQHGPNALDSYSEVFECCYQGI